MIVNASCGLVLDCFPFQTIPFWTEGALVALYMVLGSPFLHRSVLIVTQVSSGNSIQRVLSRCLLLAGGELFSQDGSSGGGNEGGREVGREEFVRCTERGELCFPFWDGLNITSKLEGWRGDA